MRKPISQRIIAGIRMIHVLLLFFMSIITISCGATHNLSLKESDEEVTESIKHLSNKIEEHKSLERIVQTKEVLVGESNREIGRFEQCIKEKEQQVAADIQAAVIKSGTKAPTRGTKKEQQSTIFKHSQEYAAIWNAYRANCASYRSIS